MTNDSFNALLRDHSRRLYSIAFRMLRNKQEAEDVVQDVFIRLWKMRDGLNKYKDIGALMTTMTRNCSVDVLRKWKFSASEEPSGNINSGLEITSPHDQMVASENVRIVREIINKLPTNYREIVWLKDICGLSYEEIAEILKSNVNMLRVTLSRARGMIRNEYIQYNNERRKN